MSIYDDIAEKILAHGYWKRDEIALIIREGIEKTKPAKESSSEIILDLVDALKSVLASAEDIHPGMLRAKVQIYHADLVKIKAALAKAEGR